MTPSTTIRFATARQRGGAAVEFALVFPILFLLVYGVIVYSYVYVIQQSLTYAAQLGAEAAVAVDPVYARDNPGAHAAAVRSTAYSALSWLPAGQRERFASGPTDERIVAEVCPAGGVVQGVTCPAAGDAMLVRIVFQVTTPRPLFPVLNLYIVGAVPPLPETLTASAIVQI